MSRIGTFDAELRSLAWYDPKLVREGWFDYGMPFSHPLIGAEEIPATEIPFVKFPFSRLP